jgi:arylsulfatase A-like enzyme
VSLLPTLLGSPEQQTQRPYHYWSFYEGGHGQALRSGNWKLVEQPFGTKPKLYRLDLDPGEAQDIAGSEPQQLAKMQQMVQDAYQPGNPPWILQSTKK